MKKVLILMTNHATLGEDQEPNGTYAPELTHVVHQLQGANIDFDISSLSGGSVPLYGEDMLGDDVNRAVLADETVQAALQNTLPLVEIAAEDYDAVFYPGGFGLLYDLAKSDAAGAITAAVYDNDGVVAAVCHGPAGLLPVKLGNGKHLLQDIAATCFTYEEEKDFGTLAKIPYLLEESITRIAAQYTKKAPWQEFVIAQQRVITGQNPQSATAVGKALVAALQG